MAQGLGKKIQVEEEDQEGRLTSHTFNIISVKNRDTFPVSIGPRKTSIKKKKKKKPDLYRKIRRKCVVNDDLLNRRSERKFNIP